ncbi:MAG: hypothetical protein Q4B17_03605 [Lautropia sp.]|nr:hypothetical protein [Lautropia sp.]
MNKPALLTRDEDQVSHLISCASARQPYTLAAAVLSASLLAACGGGGQNEASSSQPAKGASMLASHTEVAPIDAVSADEEPAAGPVLPQAGQTPLFHPEKLKPTIKATPTQPVILTPPSLAPRGRTVRVGVPITRVIGSYRNGIPVAGSRTRDGVDIPNGKQASYTPVAADVGKKLVYHETVLNPNTNERIMASSEAITVISATAPLATKAPLFGPAGQVVKVGTPITRVIGTYEMGEPFEGFRLRNGVRVANGDSATYTPVAEDVGQRLVYAERVRNPRTGEIITVYSPEVIVAAADGKRPPVVTTPPAVPGNQGASGGQNVKATKPIVTTAPRFAPAGQVITVGTPVTRVTGAYQNGVAFEGFRLRNGVEISNGYSASYTPVAADVGQKIIYGERVRNPQTGEVITVYSAEVTVVDNTAPTQASAPRISATGSLRVGQSYTATTGRYRNGSVYERFWMRDGVVIRGATQQSYRPVQADAGKALTYGERVRNTANGRTATFYSAPIRVMSAATPTASAQPRMSVGTNNATVGRTVTRTMGSYQNGTVQHAIWLVNGQAVGWGPNYTPRSADVGKQLAYREEVHSPNGEVVNFTTAPVRVVAASSSNNNASNGQVAGGGSNQQPPAVPTSGNNGPQRTVNSVQTIIDDMRLRNDGVLAGVNQGYGWAKGPGYVVMGNDARGTNTPGYWSVYNTHYKSSAYWNAIIPWVVVFDGVGNQATNTRVQLKNIKLYMKRKSNNRWEKIVDERVSGENYPKSLQGDRTTTPDLRYDADGSRSIRPAGGNNVFHGWGAIQNIDARDIRAIFVTVQARLVVDNPNRPDDRARARYLVHVGSDYYPEASTRVGQLAPSFYFPGVGVSRAKYVTNQWQAFNFATIDAGIQEPGGSISTRELRDNPPPLE